jgi:hypothetical protein
LRTFALLEIKISYIGDGRKEIEEGDPRISELLVQASGYFTKVNLQPNALHKKGGYVRVFVVFGRFYTEIRPVYSEAIGMWLPQEFQPWLHIFEAKVDGRRPLFHALAEEVATYWYTCE